MPRYLVLACIFLGSLLRTSSFAQTAPKATTVKDLAVQIVHQTPKEITYRVINESNQPLTSYTVGIDFTFADGTSSRAEVSGEWALHPIAAGASFENSYPLDGDRIHGTATGANIVPLVAIFADGTAEATDKAVLHRIADHRVMVRKAHEIIVAAVQQALNDPHPSAKALAALQAAIAQSDAETAGPGHKVIIVGKTPIQPDEGLLNDAIKYLQSTQGNSDERAELSKYLATEQEKLNQASEASPLDRFEPRRDIPTGGTPYS